MAEQPIHQMVVGHLCMYVCMSVYLKNAIQPWLTKLNNSSYNNDAQHNTPISQEKLAKFWQENKKKAVKVIKNESVCSNPVRPRINNKKTEEYFQVKYNHPKANLVEIVKSYAGLNTAEVQQFIPGEILKILKSCRLRSSCGKDRVFYKDLLDNWQVIQHEVTAIYKVLNCDKPSRSKRLGRCFITKNTEKEL